MGQTLSDPLHTATAPGRPKWKAGETKQRLQIRRFRSNKKRQGDRLNKNPMKNKVLSCLGRRKRDSGETEADFCGENGAGDPATCRAHRVGKLARDELVLTAGQHRASSDCLGTTPGLDDNIDPIQSAVNREATAGPSDATGLETRSGEVSGAGYEVPKYEREDNASDPPTRAMDDQPLEGNNKECTASEKRESSGTTLSSDQRFNSERHNEWTLCRSSPNAPLDGGLSAQAEAAMTKTELSTVSCRPKATSDQNDCCPVDTESQEDSDQAHRSPTGGQSYLGTIPKLIITRDPSPSRSQDPQSPLSGQTVLSTGSCLDSRQDDESPCSDSGCGGSPALMRSPRKLSSSSSIGLSSASSFEESEDDFTGSDIESSLSPARSLCSPDDGTAVSIYFKCLLQLSVCFITTSEHVQILI